ncbi:DsrE family protein [Mycobacterium camsae]|uniref:DsrE family protein n=1 Tax=Mycobacterium gordonae TaxID=1778 RepID=UPI00197D953A|nr:DsrE family protein [Mycobacterium gordonae]
MSEENALRIDVPVELSEVKVAFSVASLTFEGDMPAVMFHAGIVLSDATAWKVHPDVVVVFHTNAGHVTLDDQTYNANRHVTTGNPYKRVITDLIAKGARLELCGATAKAMGWGKADLIPGINVNRNAMARLTQLVQQGFVKISEA